MEPSNAESSADETPSLQEKRPTPLELVATRELETIRSVVPDNLIVAGSVIASRALVQLMQYYVTPARPLSVHVVVFNAQAVTRYAGQAKERPLPTASELMTWWEEDRTWIFSLPRSGVAQKWNGHVVVITEIEQRPVLADLSLPMASDTPHTISLEPMIGYASDEFLSGASPVMFYNNSNLVVYYNADKATNSLGYRKTPWWSVGRTVSGKVIRNVRAVLEAA